MTQDRQPQTQDPDPRVESAPEQLTAEQLEQVEGADSGAPVRNPPRGTFNFSITASG